MGRNIVFGEFVLMPYLIKKYTGEDVVIAAKLALKHRLYVNGWCLSHTLVGIKDGCIKASVCLAYDDKGEPVGVSVLEGVKWLSVFVRKSHRRKGLGSELIKRMGVSCQKCSAGEGVEGSRVFWEKLGVESY